MTEQIANPGTSVKRKFPRYPADLRLDVTVFRDGQNVTLWGRSSEISLDGVGGTLTRSLEPGEVVWLVVNLPNPLCGIKLRALVRYRDGLRHGFEFLARDAKQREALEHFCGQLVSNR